MWKKTSFGVKVFLILLGATLFCIFITWAICWGSYELKSFCSSIYRVPRDANSANILGSVTGGIIGGLGAIASILISVRKTNQVQEDNRKMELRRDRKQFIHGIEKAIAKYIADISAYYYDWTAGRPADRKVAVTQYYVVQLQLHGIEGAEKLLGQVHDIQETYSINEDTENFNKQIEILQDEMIAFAKEYVESGEMVEKK